MLQGLVMDLFQWRSTGLGKAKARARTKAKDVDLLAMNGSMLGLLAVDVAEDETTKEKEKATQKEKAKERKVDPKEGTRRARKPMDVATRCPMVSVQTALNTETEQEIVPTW